MTAATTTTTAAAFAAAVAVLVIVAMSIIAVMAATAATTTAATTAAGGFRQIVGSGNAAEFERHGDVFGDLFAQRFQGLLGVHKLTSDRVVEQRVACRLKSLDLRRT